MRLLRISLLFALLSGSAFALDIPALKPGVNDFAAVFPPASLDDLEQRLRRFHTETANGVVVLTLKTLDGKNISDVTRSAFDKRMARSWLRRASRVRPASPRSER